MINPIEDGITHINIYSKGKTKLGRDLSNFAKIVFTHPEYGKFTSVEGYWYWLKTGMIYDELRLLSGVKAKDFGKSLPTIPKEDFNEKIIEGIRCKIDQNKSLMDMLADSSLPFMHYYWYSNGFNGFKVYPLPQYQWMVDEITNIRNLLQTDIENWLQ